jgi:hypothetical protein
MAATERAAASKTTSLVGVNMAEKESGRKEKRVEEESRKDT